ncbi:MAG: ribosomal L7Ae/L30e/S12e/Gadd45 family protein [Candidatus Woesearchaeota archaeon]
MINKRMSKEEFDEFMFKENRQNVVIGFNRVRKLLKNSKIKIVFISNNAPDFVRKDIEYYSKLSGIEVVELDLNNIQLGNYFKKIYGINVIGILTG